ncbi:MULTISPECIES: hypothetical protein [Paenibacillus]|uniref:Uncharacterized protein n=1 Tax=Paenibacillus validus TaxID=44253 RepID=A0A7X2ZB01_9BACL|nr:MULTISPECIES: hypothetical protein [Paenibacillus]MUG71496.1 hypothetical protein [Paenibacillus validus]
MLRGRKLPGADKHVLQRFGDLGVELRAAVSAKFFAAVSTDSFGRSLHPLPLWCQQQETLSTCGSG